MTTIGVIKGDARSLDWAHISFCLFLHSQDSSIGSYSGPLVSKPP